MLLVCMAVKSLLALAALCLCRCPHSCKAQSYELVVRRSETPPASESNKVTLFCRDRGQSTNIQNPLYWLNDTLLTNELSPGEYLESGDELLFRIVPELEGTYACGPSESSSPLSHEVLLVAYPVPRAPPLPTIIRAVAGSTVTLPPLVPPGALHQQYYIDWLDGATSQTIANIQGPRTVPQIDPPERFLVDPDTFSLIINYVEFEDQGSYLGIIGVVDPTPGGSSFTYQLKNITLEVYVSPVFMISPMDKVVSSSSEMVSFVCTVKGYPKPLITWYHDGSKVINSENRQIRSNVSSRAPFITESTLTIIQPTSHDNGNVTCVAVVTTTENEHLSNARTCHLSVLGELMDYSVFVTTSHDVIVIAEFFRPITAEVQLFLQYTELKTGRTHNLTKPGRYVLSDEIAIFDNNAPFQQFTVHVALMSGSLMGPMFQHPQMHDLSRPTELDAIIVQYAIPYGFGFLGLLCTSVVVTVALCTWRCHPCCMECCFQCSPKGRQSKLAVEVMEENGVELGGQEEVDGPHEDCENRSWKSILCCETMTEQRAWMRLQNYARAN